MIGWYVHHVGAGHLTRMRSVATHLRTPLTVLSALPRPPDWAHGWVPLPRDDAADDPVDPTAGGTLHWAPRHDAGLRNRTARLTSWVRDARPALVVVDVSVEVTLTVRLCGTPVVVAAMPGDRLDRAHATAYDLADHLLAPWPEDAHRAGWPVSWADRTWYVGGISRFDGWARVPAPERNSVLVLWGRGGRSSPDADVAAAAAATPGWTWDRVDPSMTPSQVWDALGRAGVVVTHAGQNAVAEVAAAGRPAAVVAQPRPHDEQQATARALDRLGLAVGLAAWPPADRWPTVLADAVALDADWSHWCSGGALRAANLLDRRAAELDPS